MLLRMFHRADRWHDVGHQRLFGAAMAEIGRDSLGEFVLGVDQQGDRPIDTVAAHRERFGQGSGKGGALLFQHGLHVRYCHSPRFNRMINAWRSLCKHRPCRYTSVVFAAARHYYRARLSQAFQGSDYEQHRSRRHSLLCPHADGRDAGEPWPMSPRQILARRR